MIAGLSLGTSAWAQPDTVRCLGMRFVFTSIPEIKFQLSDEAPNDSIIILKDSIVESPAFRTWTYELLVQFDAQNVPDWCVVPIIDSTFSRYAPLTRRVIQYSAIVLSGFWPSLSYTNGKSDLRVMSLQPVAQAYWTELQGLKLYVIAGDEAEYDWFMSLPEKYRNGKFNFGFYSDRMPTFENIVIEEDSVEMFFEPMVGETKTYMIHFDVHRTWLNFLMHSPMPDHVNMRRVAFSEIGKQKLLTSLREYMPKKDDKEALNFLLAFTAWCSDYQEDWISYGKEKPLCPEQTLGYPTSDCEDKVYLFDFLVGELLPRLNVIYVQYPEHIAAAVDLKHDVGDVITVKGKTYSICDPTGKSDGSFRMGDKMVDYEDVKPEAIVPVRWKKGR
jgi:hypothetical protein